jgi:hypothetical protein
MIFRNETEGPAGQPIRLSSASAPVSNDSPAWMPLRAERDITVNREPIAEWCSAPEFCLFTQRFDFEPPPSAA